MKNYHNMNGCFKKKGLSELDNPFLITMYDALKP